MIRITKVEKDSNVTVRVAGKLKSQHVALLESECRGAGGCVNPKISELQDYDYEGPRMIQALMMGAQALPTCNPILFFACSD